MTTRSLPNLGVSAQVLAPYLRVIREKTQIPVDFPPAAQAEAAAAAATWRALVDSLEFPTLDWATHLAKTADPVAAVATLPRVEVDPSRADHALTPGALPHIDATAIPLVTIDPAESTDLDQAVYLAELSTDGRARYLVVYAIASVATFVRPGGALDQAVWQRGTSVYMPDQTIPLHPPCLSAGAASLLPGQVCPAYVWSIVLSEEGKSITSRVDRAFVRSRAKLSYEQVNAAVADGASLPAAAPSDLPRLLRTIGELRAAREADRGGVSARVPEQEVVTEGDRYRIAYRANTPAEEWNAQISLLTGIRAARHMRKANVGIMRTLPPARDEDLARLRNIARALHIDWPDTMPYPEVVRALDPADPAHAAFLLEGTSLFRGSGYRAFGAHNTQPLPHSAADGIIHAAIAAEYAHVTAPLRRLVDRYGEEVCVAQCAGEPTPAWVVQALDQLPAVMERTTSRASQATKQALKIIQTLTMQGREGQVFAGAAVEKHGDHMRVMLAEPAVMAHCDEDVALGQAGQFQLVSANLDDNRITVRPARAPSLRGRSR
ncbi:MAG: RNB domain-containing ribonuclease [Actinomycetaceae bacterium]|nr:RNB domain-containing ribonuclease [Actinomycetaceae bacterium]MDU0970425.1 RNB domain-containing ribonuclease [Actinomycetaceae bacterium]